MIKIIIPFRGQSVLGPIEWIQKQGLVFRRDWVWDSDKDGKNYIFSFDEQFSKVATSFVLKWA